MANKSATDFLLIRLI